jgi:hypothetical protein
VANRRSLVLEGAQAASDARDSVGIDLIAPVDIYAVAEAIGIRVRFLPVSMEGFYRKGSPPRVMLSALRPLARSTRRSSSSIKATAIISASPGSAPSWRRR